MQMGVSAQRLHSTLALHVSVADYPTGYIQPDYPSLLLLHLDILSSQTLKSSSESLTGSVACMSYTRVNDRPNERSDRAISS